MIGRGNSIYFSTEMRLLFFGLKISKFRIFGVKDLSLRVCSKYSNVFFRVEIDEHQIIFKNS